MYQYQIKINMKNKRLILLVIIIIFLLLFVIMSNNLTLQTGSGSGSSEMTKSISFKEHFENGEKVDIISNFKTMTPDEKISYIEKLASSKGYGDIIEFDPSDGFQIWYATNDSYNPEKSIEIIIQNSTGKVVIYTE